ncbi:DUF2232 domain-containing protein [Sporosarcina sp. Marseille-Q4063]|uniref:YybS family protein n=1 Tax=Sporosarcina sp. Marseille-Q4063 TaxID=2810514 RepID=UPI001BAF7A92|nr:DUF2232 domain-containing protein [Sporosarcina sp. Marseille-Q4063]QUW20624.1 DUF2232 domain-containing protein [Sporosarcina sp. Marseille-Q4063]
MQDNSKRIKDGMFMVALFTILLTVSIYLPLVGGLTALFIPLPIILFRLRYDRNASLLILGISVLLSTLVGGVLLVPFALILGAIGFIIGDTVSLKKTKLYTFMATGLTLLLSLVLTYVSAVLLFGVNVIDEMTSGLQKTQEFISTTLVEYGELPENFQSQMDEVIAFYELAIPSFIIIVSFSLAFLIVVINLFVVKRFGYNPPRFPLFRNMKLPVVLLWCYLVVMLLPLLAAPAEGSTMELTVVNASVILRFLFFIQGISFLHYYLNEVKLPKWLIVISTVVAILLSQLTVLLGVLDVGMNIRTWIGRNKTRR